MDEKTKEQDLNDKKPDENPEVQPNPAINEAKIEEKIPDDKNKNSIKDETPSKTKINTEIKHQQPDEIQLPLPQPQHSPILTPTEPAKEEQQTNDEEYNNAIELIRAHLKCIEKLQHVIVKNLFNEKTTTNSSMSIKLECLGNICFIRKHLILYLTIIITFISFYFKKNLR